MNRKKIYKPKFEEIAKCLLDGEVKDNLYDLLDFFKGLKLSPCWYATNAFNFKYKGKMILRFTLGEGKSNLKNVTDIFFTVANVDDLEEELRKLPADMNEFYFKNIRSCVHCNPSHGNGGSITLLNRKVNGICIPGEMRFINPTREQIEFIKSFTHIRREHILKSLTH